MVIVNRKWPRVTSWILLWSFFFIYLSIYLSLSLSLPLFTCFQLAGQPWSELTKWNTWWAFRSLASSPLRADQTGRLLEIDGIARMTGKVSVQCRKKSKSFERVGWRGRGNRLTERSREECIESLGDGKLKSIRWKKRYFYVCMCVYICMEMWEIVRMGLTEVIKSSKWILRRDIVVKRKITCILLRGVIRFFRIFKNFKRKNHNYFYIYAYLNNLSWKL